MNVIFSLELSETSNSSFVKSFLCSYVSSSLLFFCLIVLVLHLLFIGFPPDI